MSEANGISESDARRIAQDAVRPVERDLAQLINRVSRLEEEMGS